MLRLIVEYDYNSLTQKFYLRDDQRRELIAKDENNELCKFDMNPAIVMDYKIKPLLELSFPLAEQMIQAFVEYGHNNKVGTENENHLKGRLEAVHDNVSSLKLKGAQYFEIINSLLKKIPDAK